jgi:hypothetical protein
VRLLSELAKHHQATSTEEMALSKTAAVLYFGAVSIQLDVVQHLGALRMETKRTSALAVCLRIQAALYYVLQIFPGLKYEVVLPYTDSKLLRLKSIQNSLSNGKAIRTDGKEVNPELYEAFLPRHGLIDHYDVFISYRSWANSKFVSRLADVLWRTTRQNQQSIAFFYDQVGLTKGNRFDVDFCMALSRSTVAVPIMSVQAMNKFESMADNDAVDFVLMEWTLMLVLWECRVLSHVLPVFVGDPYSNDEVVTNISNINDLKDVSVCVCVCVRECGCVCVCVCVCVCEWALTLTLSPPSPPLPLPFPPFQYVTRFIPDVVSTKTNAQLNEVIDKHLNIPGRIGDTIVVGDRTIHIRERTIRQVVLTLMTFQSLNCFEKSVCSCSDFEQYAQEIRQVVDSSSPKTMVRMCVCVCLCVCVCACI